MGEGVAQRGLQRSALLDGPPEPCSPGEHTWGVLERAHTAAAAGSGHLGVVIGNLLLRDGLCVGARIFCVSHPLHEEALCPSGFLPTERLSCSDFLQNSTYELM